MWYGAEGIGKKPNSHYDSYDSVVFDLRNVFICKRRAPRPPPIHAHAVLCTCGYARYSLHFMCEYYVERRRRCCCCCCWQYSCTFIILRMHTQNMLRCKFSTFMSKILCRRRIELDIRSATWWDRHADKYATFAHTHTHSHPQDANSQLWLEVIEIVHRIHFSDYYYFSFLFVFVFITILILCLHLENSPNSSLWSRLAIYCQ